MKETKLALAILIFLIILITVNAVYISNITTSLADSLKKIDVYSENSYVEFEKAFEKFKRHEKIISLTVSHDDLTSIEDSFAELMGACETGKVFELAIIKSRIIDSLEHLRRLSGFNPDSIL
jgi:hypothetical protein